MSSLPIVRGALRPFALGLARPMATAHGELVRREGFLVELEDASGHRGIGEATPLPSFGTESLAETRAALEAGLRALVAGAAPSEFARNLSEPAPCAAFALSIAAEDLVARRTGHSLAASLHAATSRPGAPLSRVSSQALVGGTTAEGVAQAAEAARRTGFAAFKLKLAVTPEAPDLARDLARVEALRAVVGPTARLRLDANEAWSREQAAEALAALARFEIEFVEQPLARADVAGLAALAQESPIPVAADEALQAGGWRRCLEWNAAPVWVLKPGAIGDVGRLLELVRSAQAAGIRLVWSNLIEGAVGRATARALAAATATPEEVHGLGTALLLSEDLIPASASKETEEDQVSEAPGLGPALAAAQFDAFPPAFEVTA